MRLVPDSPIGIPPFGLSADEVETVIDLTCRGARSANAHVTPGLLEVPITSLVRKEMRRVKKELGLTNLEIRGEHELDDMASRSDPKILGRIDITLKFLRQFGNEDEYVAIECKRVGPGSAYSQLNGYYVSDGVDRFVNGHYAAGHAFGFMLGYVLALPVLKIVKSIDKRVRTAYGDAAALKERDCHPEALAVNVNALVRQSGQPMELFHLFVDMTSAA